MAFAFTDIPANGDKITFSMALEWLTWKESFSERIVCEAQIKSTACDELSRLCPCQWSLLERKSVKSSFSSSSNPTIVANILP